MLLRKTYQAQVVQVYPVSVRVSECRYKSTQSQYQSALAYRASIQAEEDQVLQCVLPLSVSVLAHA
eukprot:935170-Rhodomonas_salina.1